MSQYYRMYPARWNNGTADLSLEQEAAFLRIVNAIHMHDEALVNNDRVLAGLFRVDIRKAKHIKQALVEAGKITIENGYIHNERADTEIEHRLNLSATRAQSGRSGGEVSGKSRKGDDPKSLKTKEPDEANASPRIEENREEKREERKPPHRPPKGGDVDLLFERFWAVYPTRRGANPRKPAFDKFAGHLKRDVDPEAIIAGAEAYAHQCQALGKIDTEHVAQAVTWLNQERWSDDHTARRGQDPPPNGNGQRRSGMMDEIQRRLGDDDGHAQGNDQGDRLAFYPRRLSAPGAGGH